jgi:hypothetical protein
MYICLLISFYETLVLRDLGGQAAQGKHARTTLSRLTRILICAPGQCKTVQKV